MCDHNKGDIQKKGDEDMAKVLQEKKNNIKTIPFLKGENGHVVIDGNDAKQVEWFKDFKK